MNRIDRVRAAMARALNQPVAALADDAPLNSLAGGSFAQVELIIELQEELGVRFTQADMEGVSTVGALISLFVSRMNPRSGNSPASAWRA